jgi:hypothetical protein
MFCGGVAAEQLAMPLERSPPTMACALLTGPH